ncbi:MAG: inositol phosphorylceramide synthase [Muribaculaceae bacterium]|nr:inositol phosphorylceramide synthase [Muribaculaceae bacterium]
MKLFDFHSITRTEVITDLVLTAVFLAATATFIGLRPDHLLLVGLFNFLFFATPTTRRLAVALLPFVVFAISYDWMRIKPNYEVNPIDVRGLYESEKSLFGITVEGTRMTLGEYFNIHNAPIGDFLSGIFYLCWVPVPIAFGIWLYFKGERLWYLRFALAFLFVNLLGFCIYYIHPAAPPWYVIKYGFEPVFNTPGNVAGLDRFQQLVGWNVFDGIYNKNANIFAAVPSLHAAYMLIALIYAKASKRSWAMMIVFAIITVGIWWTAVYTNHHYVIDVLLGIACAIVGIAIFEWGLLRIGCVKRGIDRYAEYIA